MNLKYKKAALNDLAYIVDIYNNVIDEGGYTADLDKFTFEQKINWFNETSEFPYGIYVIKENLVTIGYFYFSPWRKGRRALVKTAELSFYLKSEYRSKGIGHKIIDWALIEAKSNGLTILLSILLDKNDRSKSLLEKHNFKSTGYLPNVAVIKNNLFGQWIMQKKIK
jgi:phosphinothricin acetyltransferase